MQHDPFLTAITPRPVAISSPSTCWSILVPAALSSGKVHPASLFPVLARAARTASNPERLRWPKNLIFCRISSHTKKNCAHRTSLYFVFLLQQLILTKLSKYCWLSILPPFSEAALCSTSRKNPGGRRPTAAICCKPTSNDPALRLRTISFRDGFVVIAIRSLGTPLVRRLQASNLQPFNAVTRGRTPQNLSSNGLTR